MAYIKMLWAVFLGTVVGLILGIVFDWAIQNGNWLKLDPELIIYPWVAGGGAFFGALMAVIVIGPNVGNRPATPERPVVRQPAKPIPQKARPAAKGAKAKPVAPASKSDPKDKNFVEGMPSFDFKPASKDIPSEPMPKSKGKK